MRFSRNLGLEEQDVQTQPTESNPFLDNQSAATVEEAPAEPEVEVDAVDTSATPEAVDAAVQQQVDLVTETTGQIDNVVEAVVGLENIALELGRIRDAGGSVDASAHGLLNVAYKNAIQGFPVREELPSMESFVLNADKSTTVSFENVLQHIANGVKALIEMIKTLIDRVKAFFGHIVAGSNVAGAKAKKLKERLKKANPNARATGEINYPAVLNNPVLTVARVGELDKLINLIGKTGFDDAMKVVDELNKKGGAPVNDITSALYSAYEAYGKTVEDVYLGNLSFSNEKFPPAIKLLEADAKKLPALSTRQLEEYLDKNIQLTDSIGKLRTTLNARSKALSDLSATLRRYADQTDGKDVNSPQYHLTLYRTAVQFMTQIHQFEVRVLGRALQVANALNNVVAATITELEKHDK